MRKNRNLKTVPLSKTIFPEIEKYLRSRHLRVSDAFNITGEFSFSIIKVEHDLELVRGVTDFWNRGTFDVKYYPGHRYAFSYRYGNNVSHISYQPSDHDKNPDQVALKIAKSLLQKGLRYYA